MASTRQTWNDHRMDEFAARTEANFTETRGEVRGVRTEMRDEMKDTKTELKGDIQDLRVEVHGLRIEMNGRFVGIERRFDILFGALATGFVGAVVSHFIG
jgi:hypothetical protein